MGSTPNTLTNLIPTMYEALDVVSRELVGFIPSVTRDSQLARAAIGQTVYSHVAPEVTPGDISPNVTPPDDGEQTIGNISLAITKAKRVPIRWQGEESKQMNNGGPGVSNIKKDQFAQALRALCNLIEADLAALYKYASRAISPNDTTLFKTNLADAANVLKILKDNGAPDSELKMVIGTTEGAALRTLVNLTSVQGGEMLTQGTLISPYGMPIRESAQIQSPAIGTEADATVNASAYAIGATEITLAAVGTGTVVAGDIVTIAGDTNKYVVTTLVPAVSGGTMIIAEPGLRVAIEASASPAISIQAKGNRNMAFARTAIVLATRMPALPEEGDMAADRTTITDPRSGLSFEVSKYMQYRQVQYEVAVAWGVKAVKAEHIALLCGA